MSNFTFCHKVFKSHLHKRHQKGLSVGKGYVNQKFEHHNKLILCQCHKFLLAGDLKIEICHKFVYLHIFKNNASFSHYRYMAKYYQLLNSDVMFYKLYIHLQNKIICLTLSHICQICSRQF